MKHKVLLQALSVEGANWRVVAHLLRYEPEAQILSGTSGETASIKVGTLEDGQEHSCDVCLVNSGNIFSI